MAILGTYTDVVRGATLAGHTATTFNHSVGTTPDLSWANARSVQSATANSALFAFGSNGSLASINLGIASVAGASPQTVVFDVWNQYIHSIIR